ncbi:MAG: DUF262 domain-containing protein [Verrucomicrobia bacterium]|nr:DUF262 domain-containing protein [Verrucomicrobiota bacterium]
MKASETHLGKILEGNNQFVVPLFQRPYTWDESRWKVLWADLVELCEDETDTNRAKPHFMGSLVTVPTRSVPEGVTKFLLIDGQQRLTTLQVLLAALRDSARGMPGSLSEKLEKSHLVNQFEEGLDHFKLLPTQTNGDRDAFLALIKGEAVTDLDSRVAKAYGWFQKKLKSRGSPDAERLASIILRRLSMVSIVLDHDDNPHLIFESLNYKGEPLTQGDLIRNYFLMRVPVAEQEKLFQRCWEPMQLRLKEELSEFVRHFLMRQGAIVKRGEIYRTLKERTDEQTPDDIAKFLDELHRSAVHYHRLLDPAQELNPDLHRRLRRFERLEVSVAWPLLLNLYADRDAGSLSIGEFTAILDTLENYFIRRFVCGVPTYGLNKILTPLYNQAKSHTSLLDGVRATLAQRGYPSDTEFRNALINGRLYGGGERLPKAKLILESLELSLAGKEQVTTDALTIEHIMPQTPTSWWEENLGEAWRETHELKLHTLGNLTLTGYNAELSNGNFASKRTVFLQSPVHLSRSITRFEKWDGEAMQQRGEELAELALRTWPYFGPTDSLFAHANAGGFTGRTPTAVLVLGERRDISTWREVLQCTLEAVRDAAPDSFDGVVAEFPRLISTDAAKFRAPRPLGESLHFETNLSAEAIARYCQQLIAAAGYPAGEWAVETR